MTASSKRKTKKQELIQLLTRKAGADVATISDKLSWQTHTTRAALSGLRKAGRKKKLAMHKCLVLMA